MDTKEWLTMSEEVYKDDIETFYNSKIGLDFLFVWTKFEKINFDCNFNWVKEDIDKYIETKKENIEKLEEYYKYFHTRYQTSSLLKNLFGKRTPNKEIEEIIKKKDNSNEDKIKLLLFVVFRYRNNMFHGVKEVRTWFSKYSVEINKCVEIMKILTELPEKGEKNNEGNT